MPSRGATLSLTKVVLEDVRAAAAREAVPLRWPLDFVNIAFYPGVLAVIIFRLSAWAYRAHLPAMPRFFHLLNLMLLGVDISPAAMIGPGFVIGHTVGVAIGTGARLGENVRLMGGVQIGTAAYESVGDRRPDGFPTIGDDCFIGAGAKIFGPVSVGKSAVVSANTLVMNDIPEGAVVVGSPARVVRYRESVPGKG